VTAAPPPASDRRALIARFAAEVEALTGVVHRARNGAEAGGLVVDLARGASAARILSWEPGELDCPAVVAALDRAGIDLVAPTLPDDPDRRRAMLDDLDPIAVGLTGAVAGLADTGSIVVASGPGRSRLASLLPPVHVALLPASRLVAALPEFLARASAWLPSASQAVIVTGPSRTADIEMTLTFGVHGPRRLHVVLIDDPSSDE